MYGDFIEEVAVSDYTELEENNKDQVSSVQIRNGCTFKAYRESNQEYLMFNTTNDMPRLGPLGYNDQMTGYSCYC